MTKLLTTLLLAGGIVTAAATVQAGDIRAERVHFPKGEIGTSIRDTIKGRETVDYKLRAHTGQGMIVSLETDHSGNYFNVLKPGKSNVAFFIGSDEGNRFEGDLPESGDYTIRVYLYGNAARRGETATYKLEVTISAAQ